jgi:nitrite reductase/ring-hydroxylating ferredoxin subunit
MAAEFVMTIKTNEIPVGGVTAIDVRGTQIAVANVGGTYYAFDDACTHEQCSLAEQGELAGTTLTCTCHGS